MSIQSIKLCYNASMDLKTLKKLKLPDSPGVYFFKKGSSKGSAKDGKSGTDGTILYIGKATSLRDRVKSYFKDDLMKTRGRLLVDMVTQATTVEFQKTDSVLEAFLLESELIKKHQPKHNTDAKDDKSFNYVVITKEDFPRVLTVRGRELELASRDAKKQEELLGFEYSDIFGPYPYGNELKEAMHLIRRIFPYRDKCVPNSGKPCFNATIGLCPGVCSGAMSRRDYLQQVNNIRLFFRGKKGKLTASLKAQMKAHAKKMEFEQAHEVKKTLQALAHIQDISMIKKESDFSFDKGSRAVGHVNSSGGVDGASNRAAKGVANNGINLEAYDIAHLSGKNMVGVMVAMNVRGGSGEFSKNEYKKFNIKTVSGANDPASLKEIIGRRFAHTEWPYPDMVVVDGGLAQLNAVEDALAPFDYLGSVVSVVKDEKHKGKDVLFSPKFKGLFSPDAISLDLYLKINAESHRFALAFHQKKRSRNQFT